MVATAAGEQPYVPKLVWCSEDFQEAEIDSHRVSITQLRSAIELLCSDAKVLMEEELLNGLDCCVLDSKIQGGGFKDDMLKSSCGYDFTKDPRNELSVHNKDLLSYLLRSPRAGRRYCTSGDSGINWIHGNMDKWMSSAAKFNEKLAVLIHLTSGQPARGEEMKSYLISNTPTTMRSLYYVQNTVMILQSYHKVRTVSRTDRLIARFLPECVAALLLRYLTLVGPVEQ